MKTRKKVISKIERKAIELFGLTSEVKSKKGKQELFNAVYHLNNIAKFEKSGKKR